MTADEIIQMLGGDSKVARFADWPVSTVNSMRVFNSIPRWRREALLRMAMELGKPLSATDFPSPAERISRKVAA